MGTRGLGDMGGIRGHGDTGTWAIHKTTLLGLDMGTRLGDRGDMGHGNMGCRGHGSITGPIHKANTFRVRHGDWTHGDMAGTWGLGNGCWVWGLCGVGWLTDINRPANLGAFRVRDMAAWLT